MPIQFITPSIISSVANTQVTGTITASQIATVNASTVTTGTLPEARLPAGSVLQVVQMTYATVSSVTGTSYVDSGLTLAITPKFSTSKILITTCLTGMFSTAVNGTVSFQRIFRGATAIIDFDGSGTYVSNGGNGGGSVTFMYLDSPATTSATTYKLQVKTNTSGTVTWNNTGTNSSITLMEIAA